MPAFSLTGREKSGEGIWIVQAGMHGTYCTAVHPMGGDSGTSGHPHLTSLNGWNGPDPRLS